jgi:hypothetical protein
MIERQPARQSLRQHRHQGRAEVLALGVIAGGHIMAALDPPSPCCSAPRS